MNRFQFVAGHQDAFEVKRLCEVVEVSRSSYYAWRNAADTRAAKAAEDAALAERIRVLQDPKHGGDRAYGAPSDACLLMPRASMGDSFQRAH